MLPELLKDGGLMMWLLLTSGAVAVAVFVERVLHYHREQINSIEFINGVRNVLKRDNVVEAISICDATPGPVARLVRAAILARDRGREGIREAIDEIGVTEVRQLEERLQLLGTIAQITPLMGLLGTVLGFIDVFRVLQLQGVSAPAAAFAGGVWQGLVCTGVGLAIAIPCYAGYNYLVNRVGQIALDMDKASREIATFLSELPPKA